MNEEDGVTAISTGAELGDLKKSQELSEDDEESHSKSSAISSSDSDTKEGNTKDKGEHGNTPSSSKANEADNVSSVTSR